MNKKKRWAKTKTTKMWRKRTIRSETRRNKKLSPYIFYFGVFLLMLMPAPPPSPSLLLASHIIFRFSAACSTPLLLGIIIITHLPAFLQHRMYIMLKINIKIKFFQRERNSANAFYAICVHRHLPSIEFASATLTVQAECEKYCN